MHPLPPKKRSELRAQAHALGPVVIIGDKGLTDEVLAEIDRSLKAHELIKVRAATDDRVARAGWFTAICEKLLAHPVQQIGKVFVLYREDPEAKERAREKAARKAPAPKPAPRVRSRVGSPPPRAPAVPRKPVARDEASKAAARVAKGKPPVAEGDGDARRTSHPRSRAPSPRPESAPPRRRPRTSR